jgi:hypothetical protein
VCKIKESGVEKEKKRSEITAGESMAVNEERVGRGAVPIFAGRLPRQAAILP